MSENPVSRSSVERDNREKSLSDDRSISQGQGGNKKFTKTVIEVENNSQVLQNLSDFDLQGFQIRPKFGEKFSAVGVEGVIENVLKDFFYDKKEYDYDKANDWIIQIAKELTTKVRQFNYPRYKLVTHVTIGEHIGGGIHIGMKCLWDADTDLYTSYTYLSDNIFCIATVYGVYFY